MTERNSEIPPNNKEEHLENQNIEKSIGGIACDEADLTTTSEEFKEKSKRRKSSRTPHLFDL